MDPYNGEPPRVAGSDTSEGAADDIREGVNALQARVLELLAQCSMTDEEMQNVGKFLGSTQRPRRIELTQKGLVCDSGLRRNTTRGKPAVVWQLHRAECTCSPMPPRRTASPQAQSIDIETMRAVLESALEKLPKPEVLRVALANAEKLYKAHPEQFSPQLIEVLRWMRTMAE